MNGKLGVSSEEGVGSTCHVEQPVAHEDFILLSPEETSESLKKITVHKQVTWELPRSRILVVDDGLENRQLMSVILGGLKLDVDLAENGKEGFDAAVTAMQAEPYDLIFMDIQMPVMDGYEAVAEMRKAGVETPIVALTATAMQGFEAGIPGAGFSHYMVKPIDMDLLGELLARQLGGTRRELDVQDIHSASKNKAMQPADLPEESGDDSAGVEPVFSTLPVQILDFHEVVAQFVAKVQEEQLHLEKAVQEGDRESVARIAHWLRGSGGNVGYAGFSDLCNELEACAHSDPARLPQLLDQLNVFTRQVLAGWQRTPVPGAAG